MRIEIPKEICEKVETSFSENVLLLAMSKLPKNIRENEYYFENGKGEKRFFKGKSQLTANTKTILSIIDCEERQIDRIVILATKEARKSEPQVVDGIGVGECSAVDFYINEILDYVQKDEKESEEYKVKYNKFDKAKFRVIDLDSEDSFSETVNAIRGTEGKIINLYIDVQGGIRSSATQINAITELLKSQGLHIVGRYANDYAPTENGPYRVHTVDYEYRMYELVTAMEIFKKYGRGEGLVNYFSLLEDKDEFAEKLSNLVVKAASAIQLCDVDKFDEAIDLIEKINGEISENTGRLSPELKLIYEDIWEDYKPLVEAKYRYVEQIRWCIKKKFIQQALTILESKMPEEYVMNGVYYPANIEEKECAIQTLEGIFEKRYKKSIDYYKIQNVNHYFINYYMKDCDPSLKLSTHYGLETEEYIQKVKNNLERYKRIKRSRNNTNHAHSQNTNDGFAEYMRKKYPKQFKSNIGSAEDLDQSIGEFLEEWISLAEAVPDEVKQTVADLR